MSRFLCQIALLLVATATHVVAQTSTDCNPTNESCPANPALGTSFYQEFNASLAEFDPNLFNVTAGADLISFSDDGADLTISQSGESITVATAFYIFFGRVELIFQAAKGQGIISTLITLSQDLDEIDWEVRGSIARNISCNYYGQGNETQINSEYPSTESWDGGAMGGFHNYTIDWNEERVEWYMDGELARTVEYQEPGLWPQTPSAVKFGLWSAGDKSNREGTIAWAGGETDWDDGPFTMKVKSLKVTDAQTNVSSYSYGDKSGSWESINMREGESTAYKYINELSTTEKAHKKWNGLSNTGKIAVAASVLGVFAICSVAFAFYCIKQRRAGAKEKAQADREWDAQHAELAEYQDRMKRGEFAVHHLRQGEKF